MAKIGIVIGTTREARFGHVPAAWLQGVAQARGDFEYVLIDLRDHPLPFFADALSPIRQAPGGEAAARWQAAIAACDGFVFITAEYNHGISGELKNALDHAYAEWNRKPAAFFGYGSIGGARAVEQLRLLVNALQMMPVTPAIHLAGADCMDAMRGGKPLSEMPPLAMQASRMLDDLAWWTRALAAAREAR